MSVCLSFFDYVELHFRKINVLHTICGNFSILSVAVIGWLSALALLRTVINVDALSLRIYTLAGSNVSLPCSDLTQGGATVDWYDYVHNNESEPIDIRKRINSNAVTSHYVISSLARKFVSVILVCNRRSNSYKYRRHVHRSVMRHERFTDIM